MKCFCGRTIIDPRDEICHECMACIADSIAELEDEDKAFEVYDSYVNPDKDQVMPIPDNIIKMFPRAHGSAGTSGTTAPTVVVDNTKKDKKDNKKKNEEPISWVVEE